MAYYSVFCESIDNVETLLFALELMEKQSHHRAMKRKKENNENYGL